MDINFRILKKCQKTFKSYAKMIYLCNILEKFTEVIYVQKNAPCREAVDFNRRYS